MSAVEKAAAAASAAAKEKATSVNAAVDGTQVAVARAE